MTTLRAAVAALLLLGLSALAPVLAGLGLVTAVAPLVRYATMPGTPLPSGAVVALLCVVAAIVTLGYGVLGVARAGALPLSVPLRRSDAPALWQIMEECAGAAGSRAPTEIRLTLRAGAEVVEDTRALGLIPGSRRLYLGLPLLVGLSADGVRSVLCHELGHHARRQTWLAPVAYRGCAALRVTRARLQAARRHGSRFAGLAALTERVFGGYAALFFRVAGPVLRRQEIQADAVSAAAVGPDVVADTLRAVQALAVVWDDVLAAGRSGTALLDGTGPVVTAHGGCPHDPFCPPGHGPPTARHARGTAADVPGDATGDVEQAIAGFVRVLTAAPDVFAALKRSPPEPEPVPYDAHPNLPDRLGMVGLRPRVERHADRTPGTALLTDSPQAYAAMLARSLARTVPATDSRRSRAGQVLALTALAVLGSGVIVAALSPPRATLPVAGRLTRLVPAAPSPPTYPTYARKPGHPDVASPAPRRSPPYPTRPALAPTPPPANLVDVVLRRGDTLASLAACYRTTVAELQRLNHLTTTALRPGGTLHLPDVTPSRGCRQPAPPSPPAGWSGR